MSKDETTSYKFIVAATISGIIIGKMHKSELGAWKEKGKVPNILNPRALVPMQRQDGSTSISLAPVFPLRSPQSSMTILPQMIEVIGDVIITCGNKKDDKPEETCLEDVGLYDGYLGSIKQSAAERSGITAPTPEQVSKIVVGS